jgi:hypothetical protein
MRGATPSLPHTSAWRGACLPGIAFKVRKYTSHNQRSLSRMWSWNIRTLGSWFRILFRAWMSVRIFL